MTDELRNELQEIQQKYRRGIYDAQSNQVTEQGISTEESIAQIEQAFKDTGYVTTDVRDKAEALYQSMLNLYANMQHDMVRLGLTPAPLGLMTGQEWYQRFKHELHLIDEPKEEDNNLYSMMLQAAKRAAGLSS